MMNEELVTEAYWLIEQFDGEDVEVSASWLRKLADALDVAARQGHAARAAIESVLNLTGDIGPEARRILLARDNPAERQANAVERIIEREGRDEMSENVRIAAARREAHSSWFWFGAWIAVIILSAIPAWLIGGGV